MDADFDLQVVAIEDERGHPAGGPAVVRTGATLPASNWSACPSTKVTVVLESPVRSRRVPEFHDAGRPITSSAGSAEAHARGLAIAALAVIAVTHWVDLPDKIAE